MRRDSRFGELALLAGTVALIGLFLSRFSPARLVLGETLIPAAAAAAVVLAALGSGVAGILLARRMMGAASGSLSLVDAFLIGFPLLGTVAGALSLISTVPVPLLTLAAAGCGGFVLNRRLRGSGSGVGIAGEGAGASDGPAMQRPFDVRLLLLVIPIGLGLVEALTPANSPDELIYKLAVPHQYLLAGRMIDLPLSSNSYLAMAMQLTDMAGLAIGGTIAAKLARFALYLVSLIAIHRLARRLSNDAATWVTALIAWTPALMLIAGWAWNEWGVLGLLVMSLDRWERWLEQRDLSDAALAFAALGGAVASKYTALPWLLAFAIVALWRFRDTRVLLRGALVVALFGGFFYARNLVWTGSPIAPLLLPNAPKVTNYRSGGAMSGFTDLLHGYDVVDPAIIDESLGILLPLAALCGFALWRRRQSLAHDLILVGALQMPVLLTIAPGSRNMINGVAPLAIAGGVVMAGMWARTTRGMRVSFAIVAGVALTSQLLLVGYAAGWEEVVPYLTGHETAGAYVARTRSFSRPYAWIAANTPTDARILLLGENRSLYLERQAISGGNLDSPRINAWLSRFSDPASLSSELTRLGITHVLLGRERYRVGTAPLGMLEKEFVLQVPPAVDRVLMQLLQRSATLRYQDNRFAIFELHREAARGSLTR
ncbi:MAG: hypothetical protein ABI837_01460 [Acidobacteriota bacterium]